MAVGVQMGLAQDGAAMNGASANGTGANVTPPELGSRDETLTAAFQLGWRVAELYAHVQDPGDPVSDAVLPASNSLRPRDQLDLQLRAAAGDAARAGVPPGEEDLELIQNLIPEMGGESSNEVRRFRRQVRRCHIALSKSLWARDELAGKAYELGNGMSDTYSRVRSAYGADADEKAREAAWTEVFERDRIERLKRLIDDLQARLDSHGAVVVREQLDIWRREVADRLGSNGPPPEGTVRRWLRHQTIVWRQLLSGDKEPEAFLDGKARAELPRDFRRLAWSRCWRWVLVAAPVLAGLVFAVPVGVEWYEDGEGRAAAASAVVGLAGALGITKASILMSARARLDHWSRLLWNRAVAKKVCDRTLVIDEVFPPTARLVRPGRRA